MSTGPKSSWGGKRAGAGRRPQPHSPRGMRTELLESLARKAKETGISLADQLVDVAYSDDVRTKMVAIKLLYQTLVPPDPAVKDPEYPDPDHGLPERRADPAKVVPIKD